MDIKAILLDFDGTALQKDQVYISVRNMYTIRKAMEKGVIIIPSTGRVEDMQPPQIEAEPGIRYWITSGGSRVVDHETGEVIYQCIWTPEESAKLCRFFEGQQIYSEIAADGKIFMEKEVADHLERYPVPSHHVWFVEKGRQIAVESLSEHFLKNGIGMEKINIYGVPKEKQEKIYNGLKETGLVHMTDPVGENIQCFPINLDRTAAMDALFKKLGIRMEEVMSIGDSGMDAGAIKASGLGVAMGNAPDWVKEQADFVTLSNDQDGVAVAIEKYVL